MQSELQQALFQAFDSLHLQRMTAFCIPPVTLCGAGSVSATGQQAKERGLKHLFVMVDDSLHRAGLTAALERSLAAHKVALTLWSCPPGEPNISDVTAAVARLREAQSDGVLAFGGGSVLDAAKAVTLLAANPTLTLSGAMQAGTLQPRMPLIAVPTTAGTGSEATNVTVIIDTQSQRKQVLAHPSLMPDLAILDASLTLGVPAHITAMTGVDALTHAIEAFTAIHASPFTSALASSAVAMIADALPKAVGYGEDVTARENLLIASCMAGMAFSSAGLGLCHAMAHQPGAALHIPHGQANAMLLPTVMRFNRLVCRDRYCTLGSALTGHHTEASAAIDAVEAFIGDVGLTRGLADYGATAEHYGGWAQGALEDICIRTNPRTVTQAQIVDLYAAANH